MMYSSFPVAQEKKKESNFTAIDDVLKLLVSCEVISGFVNLFMNEFIPRFPGAASEIFERGFDSCGSLGDFSLFRTRYPHQIPTCVLSSVT